jgi:hypothetical protein
MTTSELFHASARLTPAESARLHGRVRPGSSVSEKQTSGHPVGDIGLRAPFGNHLRTGNIET